MAPEVIACDEDPDATYDNRVSVLYHMFCLLVIHCHVLADKFVGILVTIDTQSFVSNHRGIMVHVYSVCVEPSFC